MYEFIGGDDGARGERVFVVELSTPPVPTPVISLIPDAMLDTLFDFLPLSMSIWTIQELVFHGTALLFELCDRNPQVHRLKAREDDKKPYNSLLPRVLVNQSFVLLPCMGVTQMLGLCFVGERHLPLAHFLAMMPLMALGHDVVQYLTHRYLLHSPNRAMMRLLKHSIHHSTTASRAVSACYMHPLDFFLEIVLPYLAPLALLGGGGSDVLFHVLVAGLGAIGGLYEHSGYDLALLLGKSPGVVERVITGLVSNRAHGEHHSRGTVSFSDGFGSPGLCDFLFGTRWDMVPKRTSETEVECQTQRMTLVEKEEEK